MIGLITEWQTEEGDIEVRDEHSDMGGTMRLGSQPCYLVDGTKTREIYGSDVIRERHRHRYEVNNTLVPQLEAKGMTISGWSQDQGLVEMIELADHPGLSLASSTQNSRLARAGTSTVLKFHRCGS